MLTFCMDSPGLYFKLHGTHRPNSMKKTVIKRRKRVPAAGVGGSGRMSDQAAAEALVAVGRLGVGNGTGSGGGEESDVEVEQPKKKRARKTRASADKSIVRASDEDVNMDDDETDRERERGGSRKRHNGANGSWVEGAGPSSPQHRASPMPREPIDSRFAHHLQRGGGSFTGSPHPHGGFDLPPLTALGSSNVQADAARAFAGFLGGAAASRADFPGAPSSYMRSGSNAPSRTHSPLGPAGAGSGGGYILSSHGMGHYYPGMSPPPGDMFALGLGNGIPSVHDLERHYAELHEQRKRLEEMVEKTDRLMAGVKRGLDEMRGVGGSQGQQQQQQQQQQQSPQGGQVQAQAVPQNAGGTAAPAVPLARGSGADRERSRDSVWPLVDSSGRD